MPQPKGLQSRTRPSDGPAAAPTADTGVCLPVATLHPAPRRRPSPAGPPTHRESAYWGHCLPGLLHCGALSDWLLPTSILVSRSIARHHAALLHLLGGWTTAHLHSACMDTGQPPARMTVCTGVQTAVPATPHHVSRTTSGAQGCGLSPSLPTAASRCLKGAALRGER